MAEYGVVFYGQDASPLTVGANDIAEQGSGGVFGNDIVANTYPRPHTPGGFNVGWDGISGADNITVRTRATTGDIRTCGVHAIGSGEIADYVFDISPGTYDLRIAAGDRNYAKNTKLEIFDNTTSLGVLFDGSTGAAGRFFDANGTVHTSSANWIANNVRKQITISTGPLRIRMGGSTTGSEGAISYASMEAAGGGGALTGTSAATSGATGALTGAAALTGTSAATSGATGTLASAGTLAGTSAATSGATGTLRGAGALSGTSAATSGATGTLTSIAAGAMSGTSAATSGATGTLRGAGALSGTIAVTSGATGSFVAANTNTGGDGFTKAELRRLRAKAKKAREREERRRGEKVTTDARLVDELAALYDRATGAAPAHVAAVAEVVQPFAETKAAIPPAASVDWQALARDREALNALRREIRAMELEEEDLQILMLAA